MSNIRFYMRRDTRTNFMAAEAQLPQEKRPLLKSGEPATVLDSLGKVLYMVIGDGVTAFSQLIPFYPFKGINTVRDHAAGAGRNLNDAAKFGELGHSHLFSSPWEALDKLIHPFSSPTASLGVLPTILQELGAPIAADLTLSPRKGSRDIGFREILDLKDNTKLDSTAVSNAALNWKKTISIDTSHPKSGHVYIREFRGRVADTSSPAVSFTTPHVNIRAAWPSYIGLLDVNLHAAADKITLVQGMSKVLLPRAGADIQNASSISKYVAYAYPAAFGTLKEIFQSGISNNYLQGDKFSSQANLVFAADPAALINLSLNSPNGYWSSIPYYVYASRLAIVGQNITFSFRQ